MKLRPGLVLGLSTLLVAQVAATRRIEVQVIPADMVFRFVPRVEIPGMPRVAVVLSGGGARGLAHIGVIQRLEEIGYPLDSMTGTSAGALVAALHASGFSGREIEELFERRDLTRTFLEPLHRTPGETLEEQEEQDSTFLSVERQNGQISLAQGLRSGLEIQHALQGLLARGAYFSNGHFDRLQRPLRILATNLETGRGRVFASGDLVEAVRASMAIPGGFRPVVIDGQQYVDGALVENLPVFTAREAFPSDLILAVDISAPLEQRPATSLFSVAARSLDLVVERRQWESRAAADFLIRPDIKDVPFLEYGDHGPSLVRQGREAFDARKPELDALLRSHLGGEELVGARRVGLDAASAEDKTLGALIPAAWAQHPEALRIQDIEIFLQQTLVHGRAREAWATLAPDGLLELHLKPFAAIQGLSLTVAPEEEAVLNSQLRSAFKVGDRFNPETFGRFMSQQVFQSIMRGRPLVDARGSGFDEATGQLSVVLAEPQVSQVDLQVPAGKKVDEAQLRRLLGPVEGQPFRPDFLQQRLELAEHRLHLAELRYQVHPGKEGTATVLLVPVPQQNESLDLSLGYETTLGGQVGATYRAENLGLRNSQVELSVARNSFQEEAAAALRLPFGFAPGTGFEVEAGYWQQRLGVSLPWSVPELSGSGLDARIGASDLAFRTYFRFSNLGTGKASLDLGRRDAAYREDGERKVQAQDSIFLSAEWDNLDRHTLPRAGLLLRARYGYGEAEAGQVPVNTFRQAYGRARGLQSLGDSLGLDLDVEWGYGRNLPLDRWWVLGGPSFVIGSQAVGYVAPNFGVVRFGLPLRFYTGMGLTIVLEPRFDVARESQDPGSLFSGMGNPKAQGLGLLLKTNLSHFYVEAAYGFLKLAEPQGTGRASGSFNVLVGTQPFDLWKRR